MDPWHHRLHEVPGVLQKDISQDVTSGHVLECGSFRTEDQQSDVTTLIVSGHTFPSRSYPILVTMFNDHWAEEVSELELTVLGVNLLRRDL